MANPPNTFTDESNWKSALDALLANDQELFGRIDTLNASNTEWLANSWEVFYVETDQFSITGDVAGHFPEDRMVRVQLSTGYVHALVLGAFYSAGLDQTLVTLKAGILDNTISQVNLGILTPGEESAIPGDVVRTTGDQEIAGNKTITGALSLPVGTAGAHGARLDQLASRQPGYMTLWADYKNSSTVTVSAGKVEINGSLYSVGAAFDHTVSPSGDNWYWIMAASPSSGIALTSSEISSTITAPTYDAAKNGWYSADGLKRCIGFVLSVGGALQSSSLNCDILKFEPNVSIYTTSSWPVVSTLVSVGPAIKTFVQFGFYAQNATATAHLNRVCIGDGESASPPGDLYGIIVTGSGCTNCEYHADATRLTNHLGQVKTYSSYGQSGGFYLKAVHLPKGFGQ